MEQTTIPLPAVSRKYDLHLTLFQPSMGFAVHPPRAPGKARGPVQQFYQPFWGKQHCLPAPIKGEALKGMTIRISQLSNNALSVFHGVSDICAEQPPGQCLELPSLKKPLHWSSPVRRGTPGRADDQCCIFAFKNAKFAKTDSTVQSCSAAHVWQKRVRTLRCAQ